MENLIFFALGVISTLAYQSFKEGKFDEFKSNFMSRIQALKENIGMIKNLFKNF